MESAGTGHREALGKQYLLSLSPSSIWGTQAGRHLPGRRHSAQRSPAQGSGRLNHFYSLSHDYFILPLFSLDEWINRLPSWRQVHTTLLDRQCAANPLPSHQSANEPWLGWLRGLSASLWAKRSPAGQGACLGCRPGPQLWACHSTHHLHVKVSLPISLPSHLSKSK